MIFLLQTFLFSSCFIQTKATSFLIVFTISLSIFQLTNGGEGMQKYSLKCHYKQLSPTTNISKVILYNCFTQRKSWYSHLKEMWNSSAIPALFMFSPLLCYLSAISRSNKCALCKMPRHLGKKHFLKQREGSPQCLLAQNHLFFTPCMKRNCRCIKDLNAKTNFKISKG